MIAGDGWVPVIDTLRYANCLKDAGVEAAQAEAMARAFNDALMDGVATQAKVDQAAAGVTEEVRRVERDLSKQIGRVETDLRQEIGRVETDLKQEIGRVEAELRQEIGRVERTLGGRIDGVEKALVEVRADIHRIEEAARTHSRYMFLVLGLVVALGLYGAIRPEFRASAPQSQPPPAAQPAAQPEATAVSGRRPSTNTERSVG